MVQASFGSTNAVLPGGGADVNPFNPQPVQQNSPSLNPTDEQMNNRAAAGRSLPPAAVPPTTNAVFNGTPQGTVQAPAVVTSGPAEDHLAEIETALQQALSDMSSMKTYNAAPQQPTTPMRTTGAPNTSGKTGGTATSDSGTNTGGGQSAPNQGDAGTTDSGSGNPGTTGTPATLEDEISSILDGLSKSESSASAPMTQTQSDTVANDTQAISDDQTAQDQVGAALDSMVAGTYPLSPAEQAQVSDIRSSYASALAIANQYEQNVTGGAEAAAATDNFQMYAPAIALGNIRTAINAGSAKVGAVTSKIVAAQSKLQAALQNNDYKTATKLYSQISSDIKLRTDEIGKIQTSVQNLTKQMQTDSLNVAKEQITALINSAKLSDTEKQQIVTNKLKQGQLDEKTHNDIVKNAIAAAKANQSPSATKPAATDVTSTESWLNSTRGQDGYVDPNAYQKAFDAWTQSGYQAKSFLSSFPPKAFVNPANTWLPRYLESKTTTSASASDVAAQIQAAFPTSGGK